MTGPFIHEQSSTRIVFGGGSLERLPEEVERLGADTVLLVAGGGRAGAGAGDVLTGRVAHRIDEVEQHVPVDRADQAREAARAGDVGAVVAVGGGSAIGLGKAVVLDVPVPLVAVPTTYSGSEMTPIYGLSRDGEKRTGTDPRVAPRTVVYDPELTWTLPFGVAGPSGMNAMAHAVEGLYAPGADPLTEILALDAIRRIADGLPCLRGIDRAASEQVLLGACMAGIVLSHAGTALHHKTCHVLGGMFGLDHGAMNAVVLPHVVAYNHAAAADVLDRAAEVLRVDDLAAALFDLAASLDAATSLEALGMPAAGLEVATDRIVAAAAGNIRPPDRASVRALLDDAFVGRRPAPVAA